MKNHPVLLGLDKVRKSDVLQWGNKACHPGRSSWGMFFGRSDPITTTVHWVTIDGERGIIELEAKN